MALVVTVNNSSYEAIPADVYPVVVSKVESKETQYGDGVVITFTVSDGEYVAKTITGLASLSLNVKSKLRGWVEAITGKSLANVAEGTDIDLMKLVGKPCRINVSVVPGKDGTGEFNRVKDVLPIRATRPAPQAPKPIEPNDDGDLF